MNVAIVFDSKTGTTKAAAEAMAELVRAAGHQCTVSSVENADPAPVSGADAICVGSFLHIQDGSGWNALQDGRELAEPRGRRHGVVQGAWTGGSRRVRRMGRRSRIGGRRIHQEARRE